jgi:hypothetical protein
VEGIQHIRLVISNDSVSFQSGNANGDVIKNYEGTVSCKDEASASSLNIQNTQYLIRCSPIDILGIESVSFSIERIDTLVLEIVSIGQINL